MLSCGFLCRFSLETNPKWIHKVRRIHVKWLWTGCTSTYCQLFWCDICETFARLHAVAAGGTSARWTASVFAGIGGMVPARVSCEFWQFWNQISGTQGLGCGMNHYLINNIISWIIWSTLLILFLDIVDMIWLVESSYQHHHFIVSWHHEHYIIS